LDYSSKVHPAANQIPDIGPNFGCNIYLWGITEVYILWAVLKEKPPFLVNYCPSGEGTRLQVLYFPLLISSLTKADN
jgi:hypothetical protein